MQSWKGYLSGLFLMVHGAYADKTDEYSLIMIGGGLEFCSSVTPRECATPLSLDGAEVSTPLYQLSQTNIGGLGQMNWLQERLLLKQQLVDLTKGLAKQVSGKLTRRQLFNHIRNHELETSLGTIRGGNVFNQLHREELVAYLDNLQIGHFESGLLGQGPRLKPAVDLNNSKSTESINLMRQFVSLAAGNKRIKDTRVLLVTAAQRDPYQAVDVYQQVFEQIGAEVEWLPIDLAFFQTMDWFSRTNAKSCTLLAQNQADYMNLYGRQRVYPDLFKQQLDLCEAPDELMERVEEADGIYFVEGDPHRLRDAFVGATDFSRQLLQTLATRVNNAEIVLAADDGAARAFVGSLESRSDFVMLMEGSSHGALSSPSFHSQFPLKGCNKYQSCPNQYQDGSLTYHDGGGLGLFPHGTFDTRLSELARQGRLVKALAQQRGKLGYGLDERTALLVSPMTQDAISVKMEVIGENGLYVFDANEIEADRAFENSILSVKNHYLTPGDRILFRHGKLVISFADWKYSKNQLTKPLITSGGAFKRDNYRRATKMLCSTGATDATLKHQVVGRGHKIFITKSRNSISLAGQQKVKGKALSFCSYRDYYLDITEI